MGEQVETFKLTPAMKNWIKEQKQLYKFMERLQTFRPRTPIEARFVQEAMQQMDIQRQRMYKGVPKEPVHELEGQKDSDLNADAFVIRY